jgi:hypothetical protein
MNDKKEKRLSARYNKYFNIEFLTHDERFTTQTENISTGGILLSEPLPANIGKRFLVALSRNRGPAIHLLCAAAGGDESGGQINRIKILSVDREGLFRTWISEPLFM